MTTWLKFAWHQMFPAEGEKCMQWSKIGHAIILRPARFFWHNKYFKSNIKIFCYINGKYIDIRPPIFWTLRKNMWALYFFERQWRKAEMVVEAGTFTVHIISTYREAWSPWSCWPWVSQPGRSCAAASGCGSWARSYLSRSLQQSKVLHVKLEQEGSYTWLW